MKTKGARLSVFRCELVLVLLLSGGLLAQAAGSPQGQAVPRLVKFSGTVKDADGKPRTGVTGITFALYKDQAGGAALWLETQNVTLDAQGRYTVLLGANSAEGLAVDVFSVNEARWLGIQSEGLPEQRVLLVSVPYALKAAEADSLGGRPASSYVLAPAGGAPAASSTNALPQDATCTTPPCAVVTTGGTASAVPKFTDATTMQSSSISEGTCPGTGQTCVGIGNANPLRTLDVNGEIRVGGGNIFMQRNLTDLAGRRNWAWGTETFNVGDVSLFVSTSNTAFPSQPVFTALSNANMGIGVATPTAKLEVAGNVKVSGNGNGIIFPDNSTQASAATGTITAVKAGSGLTGGGTSGNVTLSADFNSVQARVSNPCPTGTAIASINSDGTVNCPTISGHLPLYDASGTLIGGHIVGGQVSSPGSGTTCPVPGGCVTVNFSGAAAFSSATSFVCVTSSLGDTAVEGIFSQTATSVTIFGGNGPYTANYICIGN